jgi:hypothetical protein
MLCFSTAAPQEKTPSDLAANAAIKYWQAFSHLPVLDNDQEKLLDDWNKAPIDAKALKLLQNSQTSLLCLRRGASLQRCDWALDYDDGLGLLLPHLPKSRNLARIASLQARHDFAQGRVKDAVENLKAVLVLARHVNSDPILYCNGMRYAIEGMAVEALARELQRLDADGLKGLSAKLDRLPQGVTISQGLVWEKKHALEAVVAELQRLQKGNVTNWREKVIAIFNIKENQDALQKIEDLPKAIERMRDCAPLYDQLAKLAALPKEQFDRQYPDFIKKARTGNPMAAALFPTIDKLIANDYRSQAQMALLKAALAVVEGGPARLKEIRDPFGTGPFSYHDLDKGFELKSLLRHNDREVLLDIGQPAAQ